MNSERRTDVVPPLYGSVGVECKNNDVRRTDVIYIYIISSGQEVTFEPTSNAHARVDYNTSS